MKSSSLSLLLFALAIVHAQTSSPYPPPDQVPPIDSPQVQAWLKEIDLTGAPDIPLRPGNPPGCVSNPVPDECNWTCQKCPADDLIDCSVPNTWGITFDDGPSTVTPSLLDYLKASNVPATFFLMGSNAAKYPETLKRQVADGHHLASHTWSHHALTSLSNEQIVAEMKWTEKVVLDHTGMRMKFMRPPYGEINNRVRFVLKKLGYVVVDWTGDEFDSNDWKMPQVSEDQLVSSFSTSLTTYVSGSKTRGFISLEHDLIPQSVELAKKIIPLGHTHKITFASVAGCHNVAPYQNSNATVAPTPAKAAPPAATTLAPPTEVAKKSPKSSASRLGRFGFGSIATVMIVGLLLA